MSQTKNPNTVPHWREHQLCVVCAYEKFPDRYRKPTPDQIEKLRIFGEKGRGKKENKYGRYGKK